MFGGTLRGGGYLRIAAGFPKDESRNDEEEKEGAWKMKR